MIYFVAQLGRGFINLESDVCVRGGPDLVVEEVSVVLREEGKESREDVREVFAAGG